MKVFAETERLILRELLPEDTQGMFLLDSDPEVHLYLGNRPISTLTEAAENIAFIRAQYVDNGIGRWAIIEKETDAFIGWAGLKLIKEEMNGHSNFHDIGYRLIKQYWNKGYATEAALPALHYGFDTLKLDVIYGTAHVDNIASQKILTKIGLTHEENFFHDGMELWWMKMLNNRQ